MEWKCSAFDELSPRELYSILRIRSTVFVVEYAHPHLDLDCRDERALHVFALDRARGLRSVTAYARLLPGDEQDPETTIDKVVIESEPRDEGAPDLLIAHALNAARTAWPGRPIVIDVPAEEAAFYRRFGFRKAAGPFLEHGMPYISMAYRLPSVDRRAPALSLPAVEWVSPPIK